MIEQLRALAVFAKTVDHGSFRKAARELGLSPSVVSHHISRLEEQLGVALLYRSTRKLSLTRDGERLIDSARAMVRAAEAGIGTARDHADELSGTLHITAPAVLASSPLARQISAFVGAHPKVVLSIDYSEQQRDVIGEGFDVAIRMGWLRDSSLRARKLYDVERILCAAPTYLRGRPSPVTPKDLEDWDWLHLDPVGVRHTFRHASRKAVSVTPSPRISVNNASALYHLSLSGAGLAAVPRHLAEAHLETGAIAVVLPEWRLRSVGVYAVRPHNAPRRGLAAAFVKAIAQRR